MHPSITQRVGWKSDEEFRKNREFQRVCQREDVGGRGGGRGGGSGDPERNVKCRICAVCRTDDVCV
jgi:hypothetical protein